MVTVPTPEEAADLSDRIVKALLDNQKRVRTLFRRWLILASFVVAGGMVYTGWQAHGSNATVNKVRASQITNTDTNDHLLRCGRVGDHDLAYDLKVLLTPGETSKEFVAQVKIPSAAC